MKAKGKTAERGGELGGWAEAGLLFSEKKAKRSKGKG